MNDPIVALRVAGGSQNQSIDCDPNLSNLKDELAQGCAPDIQEEHRHGLPGHRRGAVGDEPAVDVRRDPDRSAPSTRWPPA